MIDHTGVSASDFAASTKFYDAVFAAMGGGLRATIPLEFTDGVPVTGYGREHAVFWLAEGPVQTPSVHVALTATDHAMVHAFYKAGLAAGGTDNGAPGLRPHYHEHYYGAFLLDPDGNNIEAVCHIPQW